MEISIKAKVFCQDEYCGHIICVVINPMTDEVTHVVVEDDHFPYKERIVSVELIENSNSDSLHLSCNPDEFLKMEEFIEHRYIRIDKVYGVYPASRHVYLPYGWPINEDFADIKYERIPPGEITFHRGAAVEALDGPVGKVDEFVVEPKSGHITHLLMRKNHIFDRQEIAVPVSEIDHIEEDVVYLKLDKDSISTLPAIPVHHRF